MKATKDQYNKAVTVYEYKGANAVFAFAEELGIDSFSFCRDCAEHTPDCHDDSCLVCGVLKPPARQPHIVLRDDFSVLISPLEENLKERYRKFPPFAGGNDWHRVTSMLDLNLREDGNETKAAIYLVADGKALTSSGSFVPVGVIDKRTKSEPKPESVDQAIERLTGTIEQLRKHTQSAINLMENRDYADSLQRSLDSIITKYQRSF